MNEPAKEESLPPTQPRYDSGHLANIAAAVFELKHPTQIGPYHILEMIGQGGMGTVYKAEQREPIQRTVAVKIIKIGMDTDQVIARFESERQAVALMNHVNVARVLDAGATETGRPYFVMEYVAGEPINTFADRHRLTVRQRLALFLQACEGVEHAHQKGIIHRDLKPTNILVTPQEPGGPGVVKVIDFGLAKAISMRLTEKTLVTEIGQLMGTPEFMSPEQADLNSVDIDTRTDVYALGIVLYQLLSGSLPFDSASLRSASFTEIQRIIRDVDAPRPSTRLSRMGRDADEIARCRQTPLRALERQLKGEIEWIPLKALRKERSERYATASELAEDVRNYLENRPLRAGPASAGYRLRKFLRRNKGPVAAAALVSVALIGGATATTWQAVRATRAQKGLEAALVDVREQKQQVEGAMGIVQRQKQQLEETVAEVRRQKAQTEAANAGLQTLNDFLTNDLLGSADPAFTRGEKLTIRDTLDFAAKTVESKFVGQPLIEASVRDALARTYEAVGRADLGLPHGRRALDIRRQLLGNDDPLTIETLNTVVKLLESRSKFDEAAPGCEEALALARPHASDNPRLLIVALLNMAQLHRGRGNVAKAEQPCTEAMDLARKAFGNNARITRQAMGDYATLLEAQDRCPEAEPLCREILAGCRATSGDDHPDTLIAMNNLAQVLQYEDKLDEAERLHRQLLPAMVRVFGEEHPTTMSEMRTLGEMLQARGTNDEAEMLYRRAIAASRKILGDDHHETLVVMNHLAGVLSDLRRMDEAIEIDRQVLASCRRTLGNDHPDTLAAMNNLELILVDTGKLKEAEPVAAELYRRASVSQLRPMHIAACMGRWGPLLVELERYEEAREPLLEAHRRLSQCELRNGNLMRLVLSELIVLCQNTGKPEEAATWRAELKALPATATHPATAPQ